MTRDADRPARWAAMMVAAQGGDRATYGRLLAEIEPVVRALARRRIGDPVAIDDVVQDILLTVHRVRATYDPARPFLPWLAAIAHRRSIDHLRQRYRAGALEVQNDGSHDLAVDPEAPAAIEAKEDSRRLDALLATLPPRHRAAIELVKLGELSMAEASAVSRQSISAIKATIHRAMKTLKANAGDGA